mmetsp:Transcript_20997/g.36114  ORF Transcript_20997/g.36114 Transcript_20997/m.36114 type:complete len:463 (-) Transcript_20997:299-1687(-)|eukprot:CAMPEP_0184707746 /NCGR_PEP_ID=MMETSP0313-20130426/37424_1 /TAXON_ID=2792 /ORGANISM="Porphyridium aerugineum, Strain SAG 1380-2" /LENGTH=462 /DNA_ID=CAMNT_0027169327 /DNA_START=88 /DNA_END=1476 /DNA_ORIENTATION=+
MESTEVKIVDSVPQGHAAPSSLLTPARAKLPPIHARTLGTWPKWVVIMFTLMLLVVFVVIRTLRIGSISLRTYSSYWEFDMASILGSTAAMISNELTPAKNIDTSSSAVVAREAWPVRQQFANGPVSPALLGAFPRITRNHMHAELHESLYCVNQRIDKGNAVLDAGLVISDIKCEKTYQATQQLLTKDKVFGSVLQVPMLEVVDLAQPPISVTHITPGEDVKSSDVSLFYGHITAWRKAFREQYLAILVLEQGWMVRLELLQTEQLQILVKKADLASKALDKPWHAIFLKYSEGTQKGECWKAPDEQQQQQQLKKEGEPECILRRAKSQFVSSNGYILSAEGINFLLSHTAAYHARIDQTLAAYANEWYPNEFVALEAYLSGDAIVPLETAGSRSDKDSTDGCSTGKRKLEYEQLRPASFFPAMMGTALTKEEEEKLTRKHEASRDNRRRKLESIRAGRKP